jgi:hypothetical protein
VYGGALLSGPFTITRVGDSGNVRRERRERRRAIVLVAILLGAALAFGLGILVGDLSTHKHSAPPGVVLPLS